VGRCANSGSTSGQQEESSGGEVANGKIAFTRNSDIHVIDGEGAHESRLTHTPQVFEDHPVWSPDGQKIAFITPDTSTPGEEKSALCVMNADGTNKTQLAEDVWSKPSWSPDEQKIAFTTQDQNDLSVINVDGTHKVSLITTSFAGNAENRTLFVSSPVWSPSGNKIAFASRTLEEGYATASASATAPAPQEKGLSGIYLINVDGTGLRKVTSTEAPSGLVLSPDSEQIAFNNSNITGDPTNVINTDGSGRKPLAEGHSAVWSPDSQKIAFVNESSTNVQWLHVINADGSGVRRLAKTTGMTPDVLPAWSPDGEKIAFPCPGAAVADLCVINADGTEWKRIALKVAPEGAKVSVSWGRG
jgi:Tol biopolymer transport system component